jgi:hypothetical protein
MKGFQEVTLVETLDNNEFMIHVDLETGKLIEAYGYSDAIPIIYNEKTDKERTIRNYPMKNPLFKKFHLGDFKTFVSQDNLVVSLEDEDSEHYNEELNDIITNCINEHLPTVEVL